MILNKVGERYMTTQDFTLCGVTVTKGFDSDGASIPKWFKPAFEREEYKYLIPAILHDYMYANQMGFLRANWCFYKAMRIYKVDRLVRASFFAAVSLFGYYAYFIKHGILKKKI